MYFDDIIVTFVKITPTQTYENHQRRFGGLTGSSDVWEISKVNPYSHNRCKKVFFKLFYKFRCDFCVMDKKSELCCCILMYQETNNQSTPRLFLMLNLQTSDELSHIYYHRSCRKIMHFKTEQRRNRVEEKSEQSTDQKQRYQDGTEEHRHAAFRKIFVILLT